MRELHGRSLESFICIKCRSLYRVIILCFIDTDMRINWQPTPVFLPGKFHGQRSLAGYSPWGHKELDMTEQLSTVQGWHSLVLRFYLTLMNQNPTEAQNSWIKDLGLPSLVNIWIHCDPDFKLFPQHASWNQRHDMWFTFVHFQGKIAVGFKHVFKGKICSAYKYQHAVFVQQCS